jgi:hypothetical protein
MERSGDMIVGLFSGASNGTYLNMGTTSNRDIGQISYTQSTNHMSFRTNDAERLRIDSSGNVGIGTSSPSDALVVEGDVASPHRIAVSNANASGSETLSFKQGATVKSWVEFNNSTSNFDVWQYTNNPLRFGTNNTERMRIDASGNVGIGSTPVAKLDVNGNLYVRGDNAGLVIDSPSSQLMRITTNSSLDQLAFGSGNGSEAMRIDSSGNLLVGKTSTAFGTAGIAFGQSGQIAAVRSGNAVADFNRLSTDGSIVNFYKDGTTVGSIGVRSNALTIGNGDTGLRFDAGADTIYPEGNGTFRDNAIDIGGSAVRFKDLYLSGGVYLGGTTSANYLDDYEEGTFTPSLQFGGASVGVSYVASFGRYVKVGRLVYVNIAIHINNKGTSTGSATVSGLPFTQDASGTNFPNLSLRSVTGITFTNCLYATANDGATTVTLMDDNGSGTQANLTNADFLNATEFNITGVYETT